MSFLDRRSLLQRAALLAGATLTPGIGFEALAAQAAAAKPFLDARRMALLTAVADTIVPKTATPGAVDVGVPKLLDGLLRTWASPARRTSLIGALNEIDTLATAKFQRPFAALTPAQRLEVLTPHDAAALKPAPPTPPPAIPIGAAPTTVDPNYSRPKQEPVQSMMDRMSPRFANPGYGKLKELIVVLYYYSEPALSSELTYEHSPGAWQPSIPITATTRPRGGVGGV
jgi:hypothetical protein